MIDIEKQKIISISFVEGGTPPFADVIREIQKHAPDARYNDRRLLL